MKQTTHQRLIVIFESVTKELHASDRKHYHQTLDRLQELLKPSSQWYRHDSTSFFNTLSIKDVSFLLHEIVAKLDQDIKALNHTKKQSDAAVEYLQINERLNSKIKFKKACNDMLHEIHNIRKPTMEVQNPFSAQFKPGPKKK